MVKWRVESMRFTVFPAAVIDVGGINWWQEVIEGPSETRTVQPRVGGLQEIGQIRNGLCNLTLECQLNRIDWVFSPVIKDARELSDFPTVADLSDGLKLYREVVSKWIPNCPAANRMAFGVVLIGPVESRKAAYEALSKYLPYVKLDVENSSDFSYQINRPRKAGALPDLPINRLSRWGAVRLSGMLVQVTAGQPTAQVFESAQDINACRLELDINTSPQFGGPIPPEKLAVLLEELVTVGTEIAEKGDVP